MPTEKYKAVIVAQAKDDISEILSYVRDNLKNLSAAAKLLNDVLNAVDVISSFPCSMPLIADEKLTKGQPYRKAIVNNFVLIYKVVDEQKEVRVMAAFYAMSDVFSRFFDRI